MTIGAVRWFDVPKGYGFIKPDDGGVDVLVDICAVERAGMACLDQGQRLSFEVVRDERIGRTCAENLNESLCLFPNHIILPEGNADGLAGAAGTDGRALNVGGQTVPLAD
jgi:CspA family cold shock protein